MEKKLQVYISSTYPDLADEHQLVTQTILDTNHIPTEYKIRKESGRITSQTALMSAKIEESDIFIMIIGGTLGELEPIGNKGYIEFEYFLARKLNKPIFVFQLSDEMIMSKIAFGSYSLRDVIERDNVNQLNTFKDVISIERVITIVNTSEELKSNLVKSLMDAEDHFGLNGWIRAKNYDLVQEVKRLQLELEKEKSKQAILIKQTDRPLPESMGNQLGPFTYSQILYALTSRTMNVNDNDAKEFGFKNRYPTLLELLMEYHMLLSRGITYVESDSLDEMLKSQLVPVLLSLGMMEETQQMIGDVPFEKLKLNSNGLTLVGKIYSGAFKGITF